MNDQNTLPGKAKATAPLAPFSRLRGEIDRLFDDFGFAPPSRSIFPFAPEAPLMPAIELTAADGGYELCVELPGLEDKDIDVEVADGVLTVSGEKREQSEKKDKGYLLSERRYGSFQRQVTLPADVDANSIKAEFHKGVLKIEMKKDEQAATRARKIKIG